MSLPVRIVGSNPLPSCFPPQTTFAPLATLSATILLTLSYIRKIKLRRGKPCLYATVDVFGQLRNWVSYFKKPVRKQACSAMKSPIHV